MRCYFMRAGQIEGVRFLKTASDDDLIQQAKSLFAERAAHKYDGFEVWDGKRFIYREPWDEADKGRRTT
jgi:hypothetical protein